MSAVRKNDKTKFKKLLTEASPKHVDQSIIISVRDGHETFFPDLLKHPNLTNEGIEHAFDCAIFGRHRDILRLLLESGRLSTDTIIDSLCQ